MANYTLFGSANPSVTPSNDFTPVNVGTAFYLVNDVAGWRAAGARFYIPSVTGMPTTGYKAYLWKGSPGVTATLLAQVDFGAITSGWNQVFFNTPIVLASFPSGGDYYWVSVYFPGGGYAVKASHFQSTAIVSATTANLMAAAYTEVAPGNGAFAYAGAGAALTGGSSNNSWYGVDVIVDDGTTTEDGTITSVGSSAAGISDAVVAVRSGGPTSTTLSATATDPLSAVGTDSLTVSMGGSSRHTLRRSMFQVRTNWSSLEFTNTVYGPELVQAGAESATELGVCFTTQRNCRIVGINIYKHPLAAGAIPVTLWDFAGNVLATKTVTWAVDGGGWREVLFNSPVDVVADINYIASYYPTNGAWAANPWVFNGMNFYDYPFKVLAFSASGIDKVYGSRVGFIGAGSTPPGFPRTAWHANYYVDPIAEWEDDRPAGGADYLDQFPNGGSSFGFPIAVYYPDPPFLGEYASIGVNTALGVPIDVAGYREAILASGMDIYSATTGGAAAEFFAGDAALAARVKGYSLWDEPDMVHNGATPDRVKEALLAIRRVDSTRPVDLNLGMWAAQGISFQWWPVGATVDLVNEYWRGYGETPDILSCDWYCMNGRGNERYGIWVYPRQVQKMQQISDGRVPIWTYIETCPIQNGSRPTAIEVKRASWSAIIAGATGIVFFDHQFPDAEFPGQDFAWSLHNPAMKAGIAELTAEIQSVSAAIMSPPLDLVTDVASSNSTAGPRGGTYGVPIHHASRASGAYEYLFAQAIRPGDTTGTFTVPAAAGKTITVLGESRTLNANGSGVFSDAFTDGDYTYHLYRWTA